MINEINQNYVRSVRIDLPSLEKGTSGENIELWDLIYEKIIMTSLTDEKIQLINGSYFVTSLGGYFGSTNMRINFIYNNEIREFYINSTGHYEIN